jgi:Zn-dependent M28 family amino/carboxypeptidase
MEQAMPLLVDRQRLKSHLDDLAATPRPASSPQLEAARQYVTRVLESSGWAVSRQPFDVTTDSGSRLHGINLVAEHRQHSLGNGPRFCVGAHLDSRPNTPGADDNISAVATLLEIARLLSLGWPAPSALALELVVFDLEEDGMLGGEFHARQCRQQRIALRGMVALEMLGYCDRRPKTQALPRTLIGLYPDVADFIAIIGNQISDPLRRAFAAGMRDVPDLAVETVRMVENGNLLQASRLSDHSPFWDAGYPALMITDTSFLRNPHYHMPTDTPDTLDLDFLHRVAEGCYLATRAIVRDGLPAMATN